jgi:hypothetical protein
MKWVVIERRLEPKVGQNYLPIHIGWKLVHQQCHINSLQDIRLAIPALIAYSEPNFPPIPTQTFH